MKFKPGKTFVTKPSGVVVNKTGEWYYWQCTVSGMYTMATEERFKKTVLPEYGNDEFRLIKEFVSAPATRYLAAGYTKEQIREIVDKNDGILPSLSGKPRKTKADNQKVEAEREETETIRQERKALIEKTKRKREPSVLATAVVDRIITTSLDGVAPVKVEKVYAWSGDPNYFRSSTTTPIDIGEVTKDSCLYPPHFLDDECLGCPVYDRCTLPVKFTEETRGKNKRLVVSTVKKIQSWRDDEIPVSVEE